MELIQKFYYAVKENNVADLRTLAEDNPDFCRVVHPYNQPLLYHAAVNDALEAAQFLIEYHCDANEGDENGVTPLHVCAEYNHLEMAELLLKNKALVNKQDQFGNTPLSTAVFNFKDDLRMIELLLSNGANPFQENRFEVSPYDFALKAQKKEIIMFFHLIGFKKNE